MVLSHLFVVPLLRFNLANIYRCHQLVVDEAAGVVGIRAVSEDIARPLAFSALRVTLRFLGVGDTRAETTWTLLLHAPFTTRTHRRREVRRSHQGHKHPLRYLDWWHSSR